MNASSIHHRREPSPNASQYVYMFPTAVHTLRPLCASNQIKLSRALIVVQRRDAEPTDCEFRGRKRWASSAAWVSGRGADPTGHVGLPLGRRDVWRLRPFQLFLATCGSLNGAATRVTRLPCRVSGNAVSADDSNETVAGPTGGGNPEAGTPTGRRTTEVF